MNDTIIDKDFDELEIISKKVNIKKVKGKLLIVKSLEIYLDDDIDIDYIYFIGNVYLTKNINIVSCGCHFEEKVIGNNFNLNIYQKKIPRILNNLTDLKLNDKYKNFQWHFENCYIKDGWRYCDLSNNDEIVVAVLDTGVDVDHPDLINNFFVRNNQIVGRNIINNNDNWDDQDGHGTHVAGIIAAESNNNLGIAGLSLNNKIKIMPVKVLDSNGGSFNNVANGIRWAVDNGADIINMSLGSTFNSNVISNALNYAYNKGVILVGAVGNSGSIVEFPGAYPEVIGVAATDQNNENTRFSAYFSNTNIPNKFETHKGVDISAPGLNILSTYDQYNEDFNFGNNNNVLKYLSGTSMATPIVSGCLAVLLQQNKEFRKNPLLVRKILLHSSKDIKYPNYDPYTGYGLVNLKNLMIYKNSLAHYQLENVNLETDFNNIFNKKLSFFILDIDIVKSLQLKSFKINNFNTINYFPFFMIGAFYLFNNYKKK